MNKKISLKEYFERVLEERDKALNAALTSTKEALSIALAAAKEAVLLAEKNAEAWRAGANEWRGAMNDREAKFMTIDDKANIEREFKEIKGFMTRHNGTVAQLDSLTADVKNLMSFKDTLAGKASQTSVTNAMIFSIAAVVVGLVGLAINLVNMYKGP